MPVWHENTKALRAAGKLAVVGITQEQHAERCRLFAQWHQIDWPILWDPFNLTESKVVPRFTLIDEAQSDTFIVTALGQHGWRSTDTRPPGEIRFEVDPIEGRGAVVLETFDGSNDKATIDKDTAPFDGTVDPFAPGLVFTYDSLRLSDATPTVAAASLKLGTWTFCRCAMRRRSCTATSGTSEARSRKGGSSIGKTSRRK